MKKYILYSIAIMTFFVATIASTAILCEKSELIILTKQNTVSLVDEVSEKSVNDTINALVDLRSKNPTATLYLVLNSPGGSIFDGLRLIRFLRTQTNIKTITVFAASMASAIVQHNPGERLGMTDSTSMFHRASGGVKGTFENGELESQLEYFKTVVRTMEQENADRIGISLKEYKSKVLTEWWIYGKDNKKQNIFDKIVQVKCNLELLKEIKVEEIEFFGMKFKVSKFGCPILN